jgi:hypothetical protein
MNGILHFHQTTATMNTKLWQANFMLFLYNNTITVHGTLAPEWTKAVYEAINNAIILWNLMYREVRHPWFYKSMCYLNANKLSSNLTGEPGFSPQN